MSKMDAASTLVSIHDVQVLVDRIIAGNIHIIDYYPWFDPSFSSQPNEIISVDAKQNDRKWHRHARRGTEGGQGWDATVGAPKGRDGTHGGLPKKVRTVRTQRKNGCFFNKVKEVPPFKNMEKKNTVVFFPNDSVYYLYTVIVL